MEDCIKRDSKSNGKKGVLSDLTGMRFGKLLVMCRDWLPRASKYARWLCKCDCGNTKVVGGNLLRNGHAKSCGCYLAERNRATKKHGDTAGGKISPEYQSWSSMLSRCRNQNDPGYAEYGGRGIIVCERWIAFDVFLHDMGRRPSAKHSIDRKDNNGNYEPGNCRWATPKEQNRNRRNTSYLIALGARKPITEWAELTGIHPHTIRSRMLAGWTPDEVVTRPSRRRGAACA